MAVFPYDWNKIKKAMNNMEYRPSKKVATYNFSDDEMVIYSEDLNVRYMTSLDVLKLLKRFIGKQNILFFSTGNDMPIAIRPKNAEFIVIIAPRVIVDDSKLEEKIEEWIKTLKTGEQKKAPKLSIIKIGGGY